ncbi:MAG: cation:dicarboxylase symporter family transporter [Candidatus Wallbacteria bacterium]|nr:cation:dicarboxylase symporter family transporter [Candidatus Wallbacteria bacterium]
MKWFLRLILLSFLCFQCQADAQTDLSGILERKMLVVSMCRLETPPFYYLDDKGEYKGIDIDLASEIALALGVKLQIDHSAESFDDVVSRVAEHKADLGISNLSITLERAKKVAFTQPYFILQMAVLLDQRKIAEQKPGQTVDTLLNNPDVKIGFLENSSYQEFVKKEFPNASIAGFKNWDSVLSAARSGELTAAFYDELAIENSIREDPSLSLAFKKVAFPKRLDRIAMVVPQDCSKLLEWINLFLLDFNLFLNRDLQFQLDRYSTDAKDKIAGRKSRIQSASGVLIKPASTDSKLSHNRLLAAMLLFIIVLVGYYLQSKGRKITPLQQFGWLLSPWTVFLGLTLGILFGIFLPHRLGKFEMLGDLYLTLLQMCALPIMLTAIMASLGKLFRSDQAGRYVKLLLILMLTVIVTATLSGIFCGVVGKVGSSLSRISRDLLGSELHKTELSEAINGNSITKPSEILLRLIPANIFTALSQGDFLGVLFFSVIFGLSLGLIRNETSNQIINFLDTLFNAFLQIINWSMYLLPPMLFCLMAKQISNIGPGILMAMTRFIVIYHVISLIFIFVSAIALAGSCRISIVKVFLALKESLVVAFGTFNSYAAMPLSIEGMDRNLGIDLQTSKLVMPLGITISRPSTFILFSLGTVFVAQLYGVSLWNNNAWAFVILGVVLSGLAGTGASSVSEIPMLSLVLAPLGLPSSVAIVFLMAVQPIIEPVATVLDVLASCSITGVISARLKAKSSP